MSDQPDDQTVSDDVKKPEWEYKKDFGINNQMREIIRLTIAACQEERDRLKKKLDQIQYGG